MGKYEIKDYVALVKSFVDKEISPEEFQKKYFEKFKSDSTIKGKNITGILYDLFVDVDAYCGDSDLRDVGDIDQFELSLCAERALTKLMREL